MSSFTTLKQFCRWMVKRGRASSNPVDYVDLLNVRLDHWPDRRALTVDAVKKLLATTANSPRNQRPASRTFQHDIHNSGIPYREEDGRVADIHALRHTFISNLVWNGVHPKVTQSLARHGTITLTTGRYSHISIEEQADAPKALPDRTSSIANEVKKTGTNDQNTPLLDVFGAPQASHVNFCGLSEGNRDDGSVYAETPAFAGVSNDFPAEREGFELRVSVTSCLNAGSVGKSRIPCNL